MLANCYIYDGIMKTSEKRMLTLRVTPELHARIKVAAAADEFPMDTWIRLLIMRALTKREKVSSIGRVGETAKNEEML